MLVFIILIINIPSLAATTKPTNTQIAINLNGNTLIFETKPRNVNERILVPVAALAKELGGQAEWISETKSVIITQQTKEKARKIYMKVGQASALVDGMEVKMDAAATVYDNRTFVSLRFIAENFGANVKWNSKTKTINITYVIPIQENPPILLPPWELQEFQTTGTAITVTK